jgi:hypothetical protein
MTGGLGLPVLLSRALGARTRSLEQGDDRLRVPSLAVWSNVVRPIADGAGCERDLATGARISKRLAVAAVSGAARRGWIEAGPTPGRGAGRSVELSARGRAADELWRARLAGPAAADRALREVLAPLVARLPLELPWYPASYGTADPSVVGGSFVAGRPHDGVPAHGQDWKPVARAMPGAVDVSAGPDVPVTALLSQALLAFGIDYEASPMWPLASTELVVRHLRPTPVPLEDVPGEHGITGNGKSLLERHGVAQVTGGGKVGSTVQLTPLGEAIRSRHEPTVAAVESSWRDRFGTEAVAALRGVLESDPAAADPSLPDHVVAPLHLG